MLICYISSFGEISVQIFHIFFQIIGLLVFCICSGFKSLSEIHFENIFCQSETCLSTLNFFCDQFSSVQFSHSVVRLLGTPWAATCQASVSITNSCSLLKLMSIESVMPSNHLILSHPFLLLPSIFPSIRVFSNEPVLHIRWESTGVSASASVLPMNILDWFPLGSTGLISLQSKGLSRVFSNTTVQKHQFFSAQLSL